MKTLVLAIGNTLLSDEGAGLQVLKKLQATHHADDAVEFLDGGTLSFTLAAAVSEADNLIVIDAAQLQREAGAVDCMVNEQMDAFLGACKRSVHEIGLLDLLDISRLTDSLPEQRALIGIQPAIIDWGDALSKPVEQAVPIAVQHAMDLLSEWQPAELSYGQ